MTQDSPKQDSPKQESCKPSSSGDPRWEDRRGSLRHKTDVEILWHLSSVKPIEKKIGRMVDLSISGAALRTDVQLSEGDLISLKLPPKEKARSGSDAEASVPSPSSNPLSVRGTIVNVRQIEGGDWRYGIKFERLYYTLAEWANS
jgi:hypothetical protein